MTTPRTFSGDLSLRPSTIGRGNESSSSRESSPTPGLRKRKRSFSPASDDGEGDIPPIADDDTPPPAERPLIRQAVAFGGATSVTLPTSSIYQAAPVAPPTSKTIFLPGQEVVAAKKPAKRKKKKDDPYNGQSGRFRLQRYDATPSEAPPLQEGAGPYNSAFRGFVNQNPARSESPAVTGDRRGGTRYPSTSTLPTHSERSASPAPRRTANRGNSNANSTGRSRASATNAAAGVASAPSQNSNQYRSSRAAEMTPGPSHQGYMSSPNQMPTPVTDNSPVPSGPHSTVSAPKPSHYRLDYETGQAFNASFSPPPGSASAMSDVNMGHPQDLHAPPVPPPASMPTSPVRPTGPQNVGPKKRMVTILAQDIRSGYIDNQLIEVNVPLRPAPNPNDGFYADAKELVELWQRSAARVDGPARVYALRGRYRQILLRVSAANVDDYASTNVMVSREQTLSVVVENLPTSGVPPAPPQIPPDMMDTEYAEDIRPVQGNQAPLAPSPAKQAVPVHQFGHPPDLRHQPPGEPPRHNHDNRDWNQGNGTSMPGQHYRPSGSNSPRHNEAPRPSYYREQTATASGSSSRSRGSPASPPRHEQRQQRPVQSPPPPPSNFTHRIIPEQRPSPPSPSLTAPAGANRPSPPHHSPPTQVAEVQPAASETTALRSPQPMDEELASPRPMTRAEEQPYKPRSPPRSLEDSLAHNEVRQRRLAESRKSKRGYETPASDDEPAKVQENVRKAVESLIQKDDLAKWKAFFRLKSGLETASNMVARYRYVNELLDRYVGEAVPFNSTDRYQIEEKHIIGALMIPDEDNKFAANCKETLDLLKLYGKDGERYENPEVLKLMEETELEYNAKPIKRLLRLLREADKKWMEEHTSASS